MANTARKYVLVGSSAGGVDAIRRILAEIPADFPCPVVFVQHLPASFKTEPSKVFGYGTHLVIEEAEDKTEFLPGHAYFAPPGYHLLIESDGTACLDLSEPVHFSRPSIDVAFFSAAESLGSRAVGVLLTGANEDGAAGLHALKLAGGYTIVQDPATADSPMMPRSALAIFVPDAVLSLEKIPAKLAECCGGEA